MNFLKNLFGGGGGSKDGNVIYLYVRPKACKEILQIRVDPINELSLSDDGDGYHVRKLTKAIRCPFEVEVTLFFDKSKKLVQRQIENGEFVTEEEYKQRMAVS